MVTKIAVRPGNREKYKKCLKLRKQGLSYSEIREEIPMAKSTLHNWLTLAGLTITKEHLEIQLNKRLANRPPNYIANEASRIIRTQRQQKLIDQSLEKFQKSSFDALLIGGSMLYQAEGRKEGECMFSNSDHRLISYFLKFLEMYFERSRLRGVSFRLYIHENRAADLGRIVKFWSEKLIIPKESIRISWKRHHAEVRRNLNYVGQMTIMVKRGTLIRKTILALSDIILNS